MTSMELPDGRTLEIRQDLIDVTSGLPTSDPSWVYTDQIGHRHHCDDAGYPTLRWVVDETYWCEDCGDDHNSGHYECPLCGELIVPGMRPPSAFRQMMPGRVEYLLDGEPISPEQTQAIINDARPS